MPEVDFSKISIKELGCLIHETLKQNGIDATLVGGACVSIYSENLYESFDLDFVTYENLKKVAPILEKLGFKLQGRSFVHQDSPYFIEFVNPPVAIGHELIENFAQMKTVTGTLQLLLPTDCVKDRLAKYFYWDDYQGLHQAILVGSKNNIDLVRLKEWAVKEGFAEKFNKFLKELQSQ
jgi:hypothetical protein